MSGGEAVRGQAGRVGWGVLLACRRTHLAFSASSSRICFSTSPRLSRRSSMPAEKGSDKGSAGVTVPARVQLQHPVARARSRLAGASEKSKRASGWVGRRPGLNTTETLERGPKLTLDELVILILEGSCRRKRKDQVNCGAG